MVIGTSCVKASLSINNGQGRDLGSLATHDSDTSVFLVLLRTSRFRQIVFRMLLSWLFVYIPF